MKQTDIMLPVAALVLQTLLVATKMLWDRVSDIAQRRVRMKDIATSKGTYTEVKASDNFKNQFEMPVLLYGLAPALMYAEMVSPNYIRAAWLFVALRALHAGIHVTYNNVNHRFLAFLGSSIVIYGMWGVFSLQLLLHA